MEEIASVAATKKLKFKALASVEGGRGIEGAQLAPELQELREVQSEISHALHVMGEIREKLETAYRDLTP